MLFEVHAIEALGPLLPVVLVASIVVAFRRRDPRMLAPLAVLGGALGFDMLAYLDNSIENFFRYFIVAVPLEVLLVGSLVAALQTPRPDPVEEPVGTRSSRSGVAPLVALAAVGLVLVVMIPATVTTASAMFNPNIGSEETQEIGFIFHSHLTADDLKWKDRYPQVLGVGQLLRRPAPPQRGHRHRQLHACVPEMITTISQPKLFVIPNDRDFERILADPITFHAHYILEPDPAQTPITATNLEYPSAVEHGERLHQDGAPVPGSRDVPRISSLSRARSLQPGDIVSLTAAGSARRPS